MIFCLYLNNINIKGCIQYLLHKQLNFLYYTPWKRYYSQMNQFKDLLKSKRKELGITSKELSELASVSESLLSGLQTGNRRIGEKQASRIASGLGLLGEEHSDFIFMAMNESRQRILASSKAYPVEILNSLPGLLRNKGVLPENINSARIFDTFLEINLESGDVIRVYVNLSLN